MIDGSAIGSWTSRRIWRGCAPNAWAASTTSPSTPRIPSSVSRTAGGTEKIIVAMIPGTSPMPNSSTTGIR